MNIGAKRPVKGAHTRANVASILVYTGSSPIEANRMIIYSLFEQNRNRVSQMEILDHVKSG